MATITNKTSKEAAAAHGRATLIDLCIAFAGAIILESVLKVRNGSLFAPGYFLLKDFLLPRSIGKRLAHCCTFERSTGRPCPGWKHLLRIPLTYLLGFLEGFLKPFSLMKMLILGDDLSIGRLVSLQWGAHVMGLVYLTEYEADPYIEEIQQFEAPAVS